MKEEKKEEKKEKKNISREIKIKIVDTLTGLQAQQAELEQAGIMSSSISAPVRQKLEFDGCRDTVFPPDESGVLKREKIAKKSMLESKRRRIRIWQRREANPPPNHSNEDRSSKHRQPRSPT